MPPRSTQSLEREIRDRERTIHKQKVEIRELKRELEDRQAAWVKFMPPAYAEALLDLDHIAHHGVRSGETSSNPQKPGSRPPTYDHLAMKRLRREHGTIAGNASALIKWLDQFFANELPEQRKASEKRDSAA